MEGKKIVVVKGSPRKKNNSATLSEEVVAGAQAVGAEVETFYLQGMDIGNCIACDECRKNTDLDCIIDDDMKILDPKLRQADAIVIASPIYYFTVSAQTKTFMDRCYALGGPQGNALGGKQIGIILTYGDTDPFNSGAVNALRTFQDAYAYVGAEIVGMVYGSAHEAGEIKNNQELMDKAYQLKQQVGSRDPLT
jgi:multimeric flavodoxin WrbA